MLNLDKYKDEITKIISDLKADDFKIELVPGEILNDGKFIDVIKVLISHEATKKSETYMYRHGHHNLREFLNNAVRAFEKQIMLEIIKEKDKLKNSL